MDKARPYGYELKNIRGLRVKINNFQRTKEKMKEKTKKTKETMKLNS